jgi:hypothetical protein
VGLVLLVLFTPTLIPERALRQWVAEDLSAQTGLTVEVGGAEVGWFSGVRISDLVLKNPQTNVTIRASQVKLPVELMSGLSRKQISFVRMEGVRVEMPVTEEIPNLSEWACSEPIRLPVHRVQFSDICVSLTWPDGYQNRIRIPWLEFINDESSQKVSYASQARFECVTGFDAPPREVGRLSTSGEFNLVQEKGQQCLAGVVRSQWRDMDLSSWRLTQVEGLNLAEMEGNNGGKLVFKIFPDFRFSWELETTFDGFVARQKNASEASRINHLTVQTQGSYDPVTGNLALDRLNIASPALAVDGRISGRFEETGLVVNLLNAQGRFDSSVLPSLVPSLAEFLGEEGNIAGLCRFDFQWQRKPVGYVVNASIDADAVRLSQPEVANKGEMDPLHWSMAVRADDKDWPWMVVDHFEFMAGPIKGRGTGRLPMIHSGDELSWWLGEAKRAGTLQLAIDIPAVEWLGRRVESVGRVLRESGLSGPVTLRMGYAGRDDVGRVDLEAELAENATLAWQDQFVKPVGEKLAVNLQGFWPWQTQQPQMWLYLFGRCGEAEIQTKDRPIKMVWAFSENSEGKARIDVLNDTALEISGLDHLLACMPRLRKETKAMTLAGQATLQAGAAVQASLSSTGWEPQRARAFFDLHADQTRISIPELFRKDEGIPLRWFVDYSYNAAEARQTLNSDVNWQESRSQLKVVRLDGAEPKIRGRYEISLNGLGRTLASLPGLKKYLPEGLDVDGGVKGVWHWFTDSAGSGVDWRVDGVDAAVMIDGRPIKRRGEPAAFSGELTLPVKNGDQPPVYTISKLRSQIGGSYVDLRHGSFRPRALPENQWLEMWGVEPWLMWRQGPVEAFDLELTGRVETEGSLWEVTPALAALRDRYGLKGYVDFDVRSGLENAQLRTAVSSRLDDLGILYGGTFAKQPGLPGCLDLTMYLWPDSRDDKIYYCQVDPIRLDLGFVKTAGRGYGEFYWSDDRTLRMKEGLAAIDLRLDDLGKLEELAPKLNGVRAGGGVTADLTLKHRDGKNSLGPCLVRLDGMRAERANQPMMVDGTVRFSDDYTNCDDWVFAAGISSLRANWHVLMVNGGVTGVADVKSDHFDVDQVQAVFDALTAEKTTTKASPATGPTQPVNQEKWLAAFQPWREMGMNSDFLLNLGATSFQMTDPRSGLRQELQDFRSQIDLNRTDPEKSRPTGNLRFWNRVADGLTYGIFTAWLDEENPTLEIASSIDNIKMSEEFRPLVEDFFPGLRVEDRYTTHEKVVQKMFTTRETGLNYPVGYGNMIFTEGDMEGRAAPSWVIQIFPGLNFTRYNFSRMHNWFSKKSNGVVHNNMIFVGKPWNLYIEGDSNPDKTVVYEVGVDVLARYESEYWSSVGQGRVPIFVTSGQIVKGKMENQRIQYVPPHEVIYRILVKNNAITGAYRFLKKNRP